MISVYRDEVKDALYRRARKCTIRNGIVRARPPKSWGADDVRRLRRDLYLAQAVFAQVLGVSPATVISWENGASTPSKMACRLLDLLAAYPDVLLEASVVEISSGPDERPGRRK